MPIQIELDLRVEHSGNEIVLRGEGENITAEFDSLSSLRRMKKSLPSISGPFSAACRIPGMDSLKARILVRGRAVATLQTSGHVARTRILWPGLLATVLHLPAPSRP